MRLATLRFHSATFISLLCAEGYLICLGRENFLCLWKIGSWSTPSSTLNVISKSPPTCLCYNETHSNKILLGFKDGKIQIVNFVTGKLIHQIKGWKSEIRSICSSTSPNVVGVCCDNGNLGLYHIKYDEILLTFAETNYVSKVHKASSSEDQISSSGSCFSYSLLTASFTKDVDPPLVA